MRSIMLTDRSERQRLHSTSLVERLSGIPQADFGATHEIDFKGFGVNHLFQAGSSVRVRIASRDFPFFLPRSNQPTDQDLYRNTDGPSHVILPVVP